MKKKPIKDKKIRKEDLVKAKGGLKGAGDVLIPKKA